MKKKLFQVLIGGAALVLALSGCGGGGGGSEGGRDGSGGGTSPTPPPASPTEYTVGGTVYGLVGEVVLQNNGVDTITVSSDGSFLFRTSLSSGSTYNVTVVSQPVNQTCDIVYGSGVVGSKNISSVNVNCEHPWPTFQHDAQRTGRSPFLGPQTNTIRCESSLGVPEPLETIDLGSPVAAKDGTIYIVASFYNKATATLYAINPDCTQRWSFQLNGAATTTPAIGQDGTIYVHTNGKEGNIASVHRFTAVRPNGTLRWEFKFNNGLASFNRFDQSSPIVLANGTVWVNGIGLYAFDAEGNIICENDTDSMSEVSPAFNPNTTTLYSIDGISIFHAVNTSTCQREWILDLVLSGGNSSFSGSPSVDSDGTIYICNDTILIVNNNTLRDRNIFALNVDGTIRWKSPTAAFSESTPAIGPDGTIYFTTEDNLQALNKDGTVKWKFTPTLGFVGSPSPIIDANGTIFVRSPFEIYAIRSDGSVIWSKAGNANGIGLASSAALVGNGVFAIGDGGGLSTPAKLIIFSDPN